MRILLDASGIVNKTTGVGQYSLQLLKAIAELDEQNEYTVLLQRNLHEDHRVFDLRNRPNFTLKKVNIPAIGHKKQILFPWVLKSLRTQYDLLHSLNSELPLFHNLKSVVTIHDLKYLRYPRFLKGAFRLKGSYLKYIIQKGADKADKIIAVSRSTKSDIVTLLGIEEDKIEVIYEASNLGLYSVKNSTDKCPIIERYSIRRPYFLYIGEKRPHKNLEGLIEAFAIFKSRYDKWGSHLVIVGKEYSQYKGPLVQAKEHGLLESIIFTGFVPDEHLEAIYSEAEVFLLVSFYEGFGIPILEAMECGTPVITSNISSMPEVAGDAAILVNPHDPEEIAKAMFAIMDSSSLRDELIQKGYERVQMFSWDKTARQTLEVYEEVYKM